ncbi:neutral zinc metallopeptidase [Amycolatopsis ultiminotia]|uniref:Neutral zinc metallopeptidase n=1 Tax=Amycolatopsis ultiminotia TaxID=543629 RepID=A0ABP6VBL3_9PSEU
MLAAVVVVVVAVGLMAAVPNEVTGHAVAVPGGATARSREDGGSPVRELATNPLLGEGVVLSPVTCDLPELGQSGARLEAYYHALTGCLGQAWRPALERAGEPVIDVKVSVTLPKVSACGSAPSREEAVAYYCGGDTTIYAPTEWMMSDAGAKRARHLATIAHEYGHHVQRESGILDAAAERMSSSQPSDPADQAVVRRIELQANCFGALFLAVAAGRGSIGRATANAAVADYGRADDSGDHGTRDHQIAWAKAGYSGAGPVACNTWSAPEDQVS